MEKKHFGVDRETLLKLKPLIFLGVAQRQLLVCHRRFGTLYRFHLRRTR